jgi:ATP-dependent DNA helicase RecG
MTKTRIDELLRNGEGLTIEFKRCSGKIEHDVFESICAFLNRFGGDVLLGVENDGTAVGVKGDAVALRNNIMNVANDENAFDPVAYIAPKTHVERQVEMP